MFGTATKAIDRTRTKAFSEAEVIEALHWTRAQFEGARAIGLDTHLTTIDEAMAGNPVARVRQERRIHPHALLLWLERLRAVGVEQINGHKIADLLGA